MYRWLREEKYISSLAEFRSLTICQIRLFLKTSKRIDDNKRLNKRANAELRKSKV